MGVIILPCFLAAREKDAYIKKHASGTDMFDTGSISVNLSSQSIIDQSMHRETEKLLSRRLIVSLVFTTEIIDYIVRNMHSGGDDCRWERTVMGHTFSMSRASCSDASEGAKTIVATFRSWLHAHEEAQIMLASILVVIGLWWLVRTVLALLINLVCPILVVLLAVVCVPQLRTPLLGQNYPLVANLLRDILMKMANNIQA